MKRIAIIMFIAFIVTSAFVYKNYLNIRNRAVIIFKPGFCGTITPPDGAGVIPLLQQ